MTIHREHAYLFGEYQHVRNFYKLNFYFVQKTLQELKPRVKKEIQKILTSQARGNMSSTLKGIEAVKCLHFSFEGAC